MKIEDVRNPWTVVYKVKDMPKKTGYILVKSNTGYTYVGWWNAHKRQLFIEAIRNEYDYVNKEHVMLGKVDGYRIKFNGDDRGMCVAWCAMPNDNEDWE